MQTVGRVEIWFAVQLEGIRQRRHDGKPDEVEGEVREERTVEQLLVGVGKRVDFEVGSNRTERSALDLVTGPIRQVTFSAYI